MNYMYFGSLPISLGAVNLKIIKTILAQIKLVKPLDQIELMSCINIH